MKRKLFTGPSGVALVFLYSVIRTYVISDYRFFFLAKVHIHIRQCSKFGCSMLNFEFFCARRTNKPKFGATSFVCWICDKSSGKWAEKDKTQLLLVTCLNCILKHFVLRFDAIKDNNLIVSIMLFKTNDNCVSFKR